MKKGSNHMKVDGACACGAIRVEAEADPEKTQVCHCTDCQTATGTAFRVSIPVDGATVKISGKPANYVKTTAESGRPRVQAFCGTCGTPIYSTSVGEGVQPSYTLRVGILRQRDQLTPRRQIWWRSSRPWVTQLDDLPKYEKQT
jgi:hypothetical protein